MDEQLTYARKLQATGYTLVQVRDALLKQNADERTVFVVMNNLAAHAAGGPTLPPSSLAAQPASAQAPPALVNSGAYVKYVREAVARGLAWKDIDKAIAAQGITRQDRDAIFTEAGIPVVQPTTNSAQPHDTPSVLPATEAAPVAQPDSPAATSDSTGTLSISHEQPQPVLQTPAAPQAQPEPKPAAPDNSLEDAEEKLAEATGHLGAVVDHLSEVVDKLEDDIKRPPPPPSPSF